MSELLRPRRVTVAWSTRSERGYRGPVGRTHVLDSDSRGDRIGGAPLLCGRFTADESLGTSFEPRGRGDCRACFRIAARRGFEVVA